MTPIRLEIFSDYTCPWCYVGWARLEKALGRLPSDISVEVAADVWAHMQESLRANAGAEGLEVGNRPKVSNTHRALLAGAWAQAEQSGAFPTFHERLFVGYFAEGRDLGDPAVVDDLAASAGIDVEAMRMAIDRGAWASTLADTTADARAMGITGAPTFVFDRRFATSGAQPVDVLLRAFEAAGEVSTPRPPA